ncbi:MAG: DNA polymerase III subunit delta [Rhodoferax sp.]
MQLDPQQLSAHLRQGLRALYTVLGDEPLLVQEALDALRAQARAQGYTERRSFVVSGAHFDWSEVLASACSPGLFADRQILELTLPSGKPGKDGARALEQLARSTADQDTTLVLLRLPRLDKATRSTPWFAALGQHGVTLEVQPVDRAALPTWIAQRLGAQNQRVASGVQGQRALQFFADRVEGNLLAAHQEIQKLALLYPAGELSLEQIQAAVLDVARFDVFKLSEAVLGAQVARVQRMLDGLRAEGVAEVLVHYALAEDIRALHRIRQAMQAGTPLPLALREQRVWGVREHLFERALPKLTLRQTRQWLLDAHRVDGIVKGLPQPDWPTDAWDALAHLALAVARTLRHAGAR